MTSFLLRRMSQFVVSLFGITIITFGIMHLAPGEPTVVGETMNPRITSQARENLRRLYGLDRPLPVQYADWLKRSLSLDFGRSLSDGEPVAQKIATRIPITLTINLLSLIAILVIAVPIGVLAATRQYSFFDKLTTLLVYGGFAVPTFWLALLLMMLFGVWLGWLPISGYQSIEVSGMNPFARIADWTRHLALPVFVSAFGGLAGFSRYVRSKMLEVIRQDYVRTARAKGLRENEVIYRHALRNALIPLVTIMGLELPALLSGAVIFETIFAIPGIGQLFIEAVNKRDYPVIMGMTMMSFVLTLVGNLLADIAYGLVDPKVRVSEEKK